MSDIQVPDEVIEEATDLYVYARRGVTGLLNDADRRSIRAAAPVIAAWARKQALEEADAAIRANVRFNSTDWSRAWCALVGHRERVMGRHVICDRCLLVLAETKEQGNG